MDHSLWLEHVAEWGQQRKTALPMILGIVGHEAAKFTPDTEHEAKFAIACLIESRKPTKVVSGACHLGGIDIWAAEIARLYAIPVVEYPPATLSWSSGYKPRNIQIAEAADEVVCVVVAELPPGYAGMRFTSCYHCRTSDHVKSGGCWTRRYAERLGKKGRTIIVGRD